LSREEMLDGDMFISINDQKFWTLQQDVLIRYGALIFCKYQMINVPKGTPTMFMFFIPKDAPNAFEIYKYIEYETANWKTPVIKAKPQDIAEGRDWDWPGTEVKIEIVEFDGIGAHIPRDRMDEILKTFTKEWKNRLIREKKEDDENK
jgi:hypothetical protein